MISFPWFYAAFTVLQCCVAAGTARRPELGASNSLHLESPTQPQLAIRPPCRPLDFGLRGECCREIEEAPPFGGASFLARNSQLATRLVHISHAAAVSTRAGASFFSGTPRFLLSTFSAFSHNFSKLRTRHSSSNAFHVQRGRLRRPRRHNAKYGAVAPANFDRAVTLCFFQHCGKIPACF